MHRERKKNRLPGYRYSRYGAYYVTICVKGRQPVFGRIMAGQMILNKWGRIVDACWRDLPDHYDNIRLGDHIVMPDHVHGVVWIIGSWHKTNGSDPAKNMNVPICTSHVRSGLKPDPTTINNGEITVNHRDTPESATKNHGLPEIIRGFKTFSSRKINATNSGEPFRWQKSYYDHIVRDTDDLNRICRYIRANPARWGR